MKSLKITGKIIGATMAGALAGAVLGVLFAPAKGSKTRGRISNGANDMVSDLKKKVRNEVKALRKKAKEMKGVTDDKMDEVINSVIKKAETLKDHS